MSIYERHPLMRSLTDRLSPILGALRAPDAQRATGVSKTPTPVQPGIDIFVRDRTPDADECFMHFAQGQFLARQEQWVELGRLIRACDQQRRKTPGGQSVATLLAKGARADAVEAATDAVQRGDETAALAPIEALEDVYAELTEDHGVALVIAGAHMDIGRVWHARNTAEQSPAGPKSAFLRHFKSATRIIDRFDAFELDAPTLAAARCALLAADPRPSLRVADDYEDLIDLDPENARHMRGMGVDLLPRWYGDFETLDQEARRTCSRTADIWGAGGYSWVYFDALALDAGAFRRLDPELFVAGLHDILARDSSQHMANVLAAFTGLSLSGASAKGSAKARIAGCFDWIARDHLHEIHPRIWAEAPTAANTARVKGAQDAAQRGRVRALSALAEHFSPEIRAGDRLRFTPAGLNISS